MCLCSPITLMSSVNATKLEEKKKYLEHHWILAQKELDQEKILRQKLQNETQDDFVRALKEEKEKYAKVVRDHETNVSELKQAHSKQCDELCKEILKANLEADRLHDQLNGAAGVPRNARLFDEERDSTPIPFAVTIALMLFAVSEPYRTFRNETRSCSGVV